LSKSCIEQNGRLELSINGESGYREVGYELKDYVIGAFKVEISFSSFSASGTAGFRLGYQIDAGNYVIIDHTSSGYTSHICIDGTLYENSGGSGDASGKMKIERTGMIVRSYYWSGGAYVPLGVSTLFSTDVGKMKIVAFADASASVAIYADDFTLQESPNSLYDAHFVAKQKGSDKISVSRRGHRDLKNKITVQYTKRAYSYMAGTVDCQDLIDMDNNGVMDVAMRLEGVCTLSRADKMGRLFLKKNVNSAEVYAGSLGPQSIGVCPGDILYISSKKLNMSNVPARIMAIKEGNDYVIDIEFGEEIDIYELDSYAWDNTAPIPAIQFAINATDSYGTTDSAGSESLKIINGPVQQMKISEVATGAIVSLDSLFITGAMDGYTHQSTAILSIISDITVIIDPTVFLNPSDKNASLTLSNSNMTVTNAGTASHRGIRANISEHTGKWYWEVTIGAGSSADIMVGIADSTYNLSHYIGQDAYGYGYNAGDGKKYNNSSSATYGNTFTNGDIIGIALDLDSNKIYFSKNGAWQGAGDPVAGTGAAYTISDQADFPAISIYSANTPATINFGASGFNYNVPTGYKPIDSECIIFTDTATCAIT
jgi:hypothetical protein